jgi:hypothetical protein
MVRPASASSIQVPSSKNSSSGTIRPSSGLVFRESKTEQRVSRPLEEQSNPHISDLWLMNQTDICTQDVPSINKSSADEGDSCLHGSSFNDSQEEDDFIKEDNSENEDDDDLLDKFDASSCTRDRTSIEVKHVNQRPTSAMKRERPSSAVQSSRVQAWWSETGHEHLQKLEPVVIPFFELFEPLARRLATGSVASLIAFVEKGSPELCIEGLENAIRAITRVKGKDIAGLADTTYKIAVVSCFCGLLLMRQKKLSYAKDVLMKSQMLTGSYTPDFRHKNTLRTWVVCLLSELYSQLNMPKVTMEYIETGVDHAKACKCPASKVTSLLMRMRQYIRSSKLDQAMADVDAAKGALRALESQCEPHTAPEHALFRPLPKQTALVMRVCMAHNAALVLLCQQPPRLSEARENANLAWKLSRELDEKFAGLRKCSLRVRDVLTLEGDAQERMIEHVRMLTLEALRYDGAQSSNASFAGQKTADPPKPPTHASVHSISEAHSASSGSSKARPVSASASASAKPEAKAHMRRRSAGQSRRPSALAQDGHEQENARALLAAVFEATMRHTAAPSDTSEGERANRRDPPPHSINPDFVESVAHVRRSIDAAANRDAAAASSMAGAGGQTGMQYAYVHM